MTPSSRDDLAQAVLAYIKARTWAEMKQIVENRHDLLLTDAADDILADSLGRCRENEDITRLLEARRALLARCRCEGIEAAFADLPSPSSAQSKSELPALLQELVQLTKPGDMPRAAAMCRAALKMVSRDRQPELWAALQDKLGTSLCENPLEDRAENVELAIRHFKQALKTRSQQNLPEDWAMTQNNLGKAYTERIREDPVENVERAICHYKQALKVYACGT